MGHQLHSGLFTDHYELTMAQGYFLSGKTNINVNFDYFFRKLPFKGGFVVFAGLENVLNSLENFRFSAEDCQYLEDLGFKKSFIEFLKQFDFKGSIYSIGEGEIAFANQPVLRIEGNIIETQIVESLVLNMLNFQSLIATKASRIRNAAKNKILIDFGLRRAQGLGALHASRAAIIGGFNSSSNVHSAHQFGFHSSGTMAHSWVQFFHDELQAFRSFVEQYPDSSILLVDTFDTLKSGIPNAIKVAKEMKQKGLSLKGIRLDSGDLAYLSKAARTMLNAEGLHDVKIAVSNQLDEYVIRSLIQQNAPIDVFGVGTSVITGKDDAALDGVYKLSSINDVPTMKMSENVAKTTLPGIKQIFRYRDEKSGKIHADGIELTGKGAPKIIYHPLHHEKQSVVNYKTAEGMLQQVMKEGKKIHSSKAMRDLANFAQSKIENLPDEFKRFENPHVYKVGMGQHLMNLQKSIKEKLWKH